MGFLAGGGGGEGEGGQAATILDINYNQEEGDKSSQVLS